MQLNWGIIFYVLAVYGFTRFLTRININKDKKLINWTPLESVGVTLFIYFFGQIIGGLLVYVIPLALGWDNARIVKWMSDDAIGQFIAVSVIEFISVALLILFLRRRKSTLSAIGFIKKIKISDGLRAIFWYVVYFLSYLIVVKIVTGLIPSLDINQKQEIGFKNPAHWQLPFVFISLVVLPPLVEEMIMRGFLYSGLKNKLPKIWAVLITSGLFAVAHLQAGSGQKLLWIAAIDTFILSLFLINLREKTGSLWSSIFLHALKNLVAFISIFILHIS